MIILLREPPLPRHSQLTLTFYYWYTGMHAFNLLYHQLITDHQIYLNMYIKTEIKHKIAHAKNHFKQTFPQQFLSHSPLSFLQGQQRVSTITYVLFTRPTKAVDLLRAQDTMSNVLFTRPTKGDGDLITQHLANHNSYSVIHWIVWVGRFFTKLNTTVYVSKQERPNS